MKAQELDKKFLRPQTFWDVDFGKIDVKADRNFIVSRVLQRGSDMEIMHLNSVFSFSEIHHILENYSGVPKKILEYYKNMADAGD